MKDRTRMVRTAASNRRANITDAAVVLIAMSNYKDESLDALVGYINHEAKKRKMSQIDEVLAYEVITELH